ncbi:SAM hydrolase/SAM-dependent halogenase family protein [Limimonas halophila]|nr:SAM-dependent chlorinase/fluorinase [Limimonas halophila]
MLVTITDFGSQGPYLAQMKAAAMAHAPDLPILDLFTDAPAFNPRAAAYLVSAYAADLPEGAVILGVVDPGVGSERAGIVVHAGGRWFVGPDNGLFALAARHAGGAAAWRIAWTAPDASATFHGRDIFAPVAARLARGERPLGMPLDPATLVGADWPDDLAEIVYVDAYGNCMTGVRANTLPPGARVRIAGHAPARGRTFSDVPEGTPLWYTNANGLVEIAVNAGRADTALGIGVGTPVEIASTP